MFLEPFSQKSMLTHLCTALCVVSLGTLKLVDYPTLLGDIILVLGSTRRFQIMLAPLKMYLDSHLITYILKTFTKPCGIGNNLLNVVVFVVVVILVSVLGLINTISIIDEGLEFV